MTSGVIVRRAHGEGDVRELATLRWEWRTAESGERGLDLDDFADRFVAWAAAHRGSHDAWLADVDGSAVGMAWLAVVERVPGPGRWTRLAGQVQSVYVRPGNRGAGIGTRLVAAVIDHARNSGLEYLGVHPSELAFSLYRRCGFDSSTRLLELDLRDRGGTGGSIRAS